MISLIRGGNVKLPETESRKAVVRGSEVGKTEAGYKMKNKFSVMRKIRSEDLMYNMLTVFFNNICVVEIY